MSERIAVLHVRIVSGRGGGPEKTILNSARFLRAAGTPYESIACYLHAPGDDGIPDLERRAREANSEFIALPDAKAIDRDALRELESICRKRDVKIWHGHDYKSNLYGILLRRKLPHLRLVTTVHGWVQKTWKTRIYWAIDRWCIKRYDEVICVSTDLEQACLEFGTPRAKLHHIPNAIDTELFRRQRAPADSPARNGVPTERLLIGAVGRLSKEKAFDILIDAVHELIGEGHNLALWIAGEGDEKEALVQQAATANRACGEDRIRLLGFRSDTIDLFEAFDLYCLSSLREGLPNVVLEAMALEVPVLATRSGGMETFATHEREALLCDPGSKGELITGLRRLALEKSLRSQLATTARRRIEEDYSFAKRMERIAAIYSGACG